MPQNNDNYLSFPTEAWNADVQFSTSFVPEQPTASLLTKRKRGDEKSKAKRKRRKTSRDFTREEFVNLMHLTQRDAAKQLNVCLSTFKRQFSHLRPKLTWPTPKERLELLKKKRFSNIISQNEESSIPIRTFKFGASNEDIFDEFMPDLESVCSLAVESRARAQSLEVENRALKKAALLSTVDSDDIVPACFGGSIHQYKGQWQQAKKEGVALALVDESLNVVACDDQFSDMIKYDETALQLGFNLTRVLMNLHRPTTHAKWFKNLLKTSEKISFMDTLVCRDDTKRHVKLTIHVLNEMGAWIEFEQVEEMDNSVMVNDACIQESTQTSKASEMTEHHDLIQHMVVIRALQTHQC